MRNPWLAGVALVLTSCGAVQDMDAADAQVTAFHRNFDRERFGPLWDRSSPTLKGVTAEEDFIALMTQLRTKLGVVKSSERTGFNVNYATGGSQVTLTYRTTFANGEGTETFIYDTEEPPRLMGWHVVSPALLAPGPGPAVLQKLESGAAD
jgi:hypothetical protein